MTWSMLSRQCLMGCRHKQLNLVNTVPQLPLLHEAGTSPRERYSASNEPSVTRHAISEGIPPSISAAGRRSISMRR